MTAIVKFAQSIITAITLACFMFIGGFVYLAYNSPDTITEIACALQTDGVVENSACIYNVNN